jgi:selenide,water dikinase
LPLLAGFADLCGEGIRSSLDPANREVEASIHLESEQLRSQAAYSALFDPQTSGGLLIAVAAEKADAALRRLREAGDSRAAIIGKVTRKSTSPRLAVAGEAAVALASPQANSL